MVDCEDSEVFDAALKKLHFYGELEGGCGSGITAIMGLSIAGIVFSALDLLAVVIAYSIWWSDIDSYRSYFYCDSKNFVSVTPPLNPMSYFPGHAISTTACNLAFNSLSIVFIRSLLDKRFMKQEISSVSSSRGAGEYALPVSGENNLSSQHSEHGHPLVRRLVNHFSQAMLAVGIVHLISGFAVVSSSLTIAAAALWLNSSSSTRRFLHALEVNPDTPPCSGLPAVMGIAISGISLSVIDSVWIPSLLISAASSYTLQVYCSSNGSNNYYRGGAPFWNLFFSGQAIGCGITNVAFQSLSLVLFYSLLGKRFTGASESTPLMVQQQPRAAILGGR